MAGENNLALIEEVTKNWVYGNYDKILPLVADDAVYEIAKGPIQKFSALFGTFTGKKEIAIWYESNKQQAAAVNGIKPFCTPADPGKYIAADDKVINMGTMPETGTEPASDWVAIWTIEGGMIKHCWLVMDTASTFLRLKKQNPKIVLE